MKISHLSDLHLNGKADRSDRLRAALTGAMGHLVITGDLTSSGKMSEYAELAELLSGRSPNSTTLVPGNHDGGKRVWSEALRGPLASFRATSSPGRMTVFPDATVVPIDTAWIGARGKMGKDALYTVATIASDTRDPVILAMHHGPQAHLTGPLENLSDREELLELMDFFRNVYVLAGHDHRALSINGRVFTAGACCHHPDPLRVYDVAGRVEPWNLVEEGRWSVA